MSKTIVFVGNPNVGKSAWLNALCHQQFEVGNWPGVTVEKKEAYVTWDNETYHMIDLPGCYDFIGEHEETISVNFLHQEHIDCIVQVVDVMNLSRNLLLTLALRELQIPMVMIFNFMDEAKKYHVQIDVKRISARLQVPIIASSVFDTSNYATVQSMIVHMCKQEVCYEPLYTKQLESVYIKVFHFIQKATTYENISQAQLHRLCCSVIQHNQVAWKQVEVWGIHKESLQDICKVSNVQLTQDRYYVVKSLMRYVKKIDAIQYEKSKKIDTILLHKYLGLPCFFGMFSCLLWICFEISTPWIDFLETCFTLIGKYLRYGLQFMPIWFQDFVVQGMLQGVGGVLTFIPLMACLYMMLALLEECGYMSRIAILLDRIMRIFHLSGKTFVAFMMGFGCNVAGIYAIRTLEDEQQKKRVALMIPFMSCSARLPIYALFGAAFFQNQTGWMIITIYGIGLVIALLLSIVSVNVFPSTSSMFLTEIPPYRKPKLSIVLQKTKKEMKSYIQKAYKVIFVTMLVIWGLGYTWSPQKESILAQGAKQVQFLFEPLGFGERWECIAALPTGMIAKETIVAYFTSIQEETKETIHVKKDIVSLGKTFMHTIYQTIHPFSKNTVRDDTNSVQRLFQGKLAKLKVFSYLVFILLSIPCMMTLQALRKEFGYHMMIASMLLMIVLPYVVSFCIYQIGCLFLG